VKIAIIGATGLVGQTMIQVFLERQLHKQHELILAASAASAGREIQVGNHSLTVLTPEEALLQKPNFALFSAGGDPSKLYAPLFTSQGVCVIDNSSAWRMDPSVPLVVPEINASQCKNHLLIANPNCSTIQLVMVLSPLHQAFGIRRVIVSTYQSVTGTGKKAVDQLFQERKQESGEKIYPWPIDLNCIPQCDVFIENHYTKEEMKIIQESRKILQLPDLAITATAVRIPVLGGHSESVNIEFEKTVSLSEIREILTSSPGICVQDEPNKSLYPMPLQANGKDEVFVGRIRRDESVENGINLWISADNLRKGAATNAIQILEYLITSRHGTA
jgi:aspartate-semialdehyde dehydrogenase